MFHLSLLSVVPWVWWIVGVLGVGGTLALFIFAPAVANALVQAVVSTLQTLIQTRVGVAILVAILAGGLAWFDGDLHGRLKVQKAWKLANATVETARVARDAAIEKKTSSKFQPLIDDLQKKVSDYESKKGAASPGSCSLSDSDLKRLRKLGR
jgi:maleate cis-trans isomerase